MITCDRMRHILASSFHQLDASDIKPHAKNQPRNSYSARFSYIIPTSNARNATGIVTSNHEYIQKVINKEIKKITSKGKISSLHFSQYSSTHNLITFIYTE